MCFHSYNKWSKVIDGYDGVRQYRVCKKCGKISHRKLGYIGSTPAERVNTAIKEVENG